MEASEHESEKQKENDKRNSQRRKKRRCQPTPGCIQMSNSTEQLVESPSFNNFVIMLILLNTVFLALEHYDMPGWLQDSSEVANFIFTIVFALEMVLKLIGLGIIKYLSDGFNIFDGIIVIISMVELTVGSESSGLSVLRAFRLLRVFKIIKSWTSLRILLSTVLESLSAITNLGVLTILYLFISALLAKQFYGEGGDMMTLDGEASRNSFSRTTDSLITIFIVLTGENWNQVMIEAVKREKDRPEATGAVTYQAIFFCFILVIGNYMLLNLFLAILLKFISENSEMEQQNVKQPDSE
mmetsp:Transcript_34799/g.53437  ORF Transcript_34799/g.53437 Transcript_34799/m.53437 type:complete len:298 (+) Transcript_34799:1634-2527(+)